LSREAEGICRETWTALKSYENAGIYAISMNRRARESPALGHSFLNVPAWNAEPMFVFETLASDWHESTLQKRNAHHFSDSRPDLTKRVTTC
jgi:hypothetical protein